MARAHEGSPPRQNSCRLSPREFIRLGGSEVTNDVETFEGKEGPRAGVDVGAGEAVGAGSGGAHRSGEGDVVSVAAASAGARIGGAGGRGCGRGLERARQVWRGRGRRACEAGIAEGRAEVGPALRDERRRNRQLEQELRRKERALAETAALLVLSRKLEAFRTESKDA